MLSGVRHLYRVFESQVREHVGKRVLDRLLKRRSPKWASVRKRFLKSHSVCAACGSRFLLNVHHIIPFKKNRELELVESNLITLCMSTLECHFRIGHAGGWSKYNPLVEQHSSMVFVHPASRLKIEKEAKRLSEKS